MRINERYSGAISSADLTSDERTTYSDSDVIGAMGLAARLSPMGVALARLLAGDRRAEREIGGMVRVSVAGDAP